jgi:hypothetical protein
MEIFYRNRDEVIAAGAEGPSKAWKTLEKTCPEVTGGMSFSTFRAHLPGFIVLMGLIEADRTLQTSETPQEAQETPRAYRGWTVGRDKKGFIRLYKSMTGKTVCRYVGKTWDPEKADQVIAEAEGRVPG